MINNLNKFTYDKTERTFKYLLDNLKDSVNGWSYFVNWAKVNRNIKEVEVSLNILNYLIGKENIREEFRNILKQYPETLCTIPILIASREKSFRVLNPKEGNPFNIEPYEFSKCGKLCDEEIEKALEFADRSGILEIIEKEKIKNLVDYVFGIEVGLDSNGRKNRSGTAMEDLVEMFIIEICKKHGYSYIRQASPKSIKEQWNYNIEVDKADRRFDFAVNANKKLFLIETNYYSGGGSKLKSTAGEYKTLFDYVNKSGHEFIWITEGKGWLTASRPLQDTFNYTNYIFNLDMVEKGLLEQVLVRGKI